jgi:cyclopropane fatty-acyl-phospholipid synthase-like methyltransferase
MGQETAGVDYSRIHRIDSPANRRLRRDIWPEGHDLGQQSFATLPYFDHLIARLGMGPDTRVLDLGSGSGGPAIYMASKSGCRMIGLEINEVGIEVARGLAADAGLEDRVEFVLGDGMRMPFDDEAFDIAISMNVLNVFEDKVALFREVRRVLRPGGTWAFLSGTFDFVEGDPQDEAWRALYSRGYAIPQFTDSLASYKVKLRAAGFVIDEATEYMSDFRDTIERWRDGWTRHRDAIAAEQGERQTDDHIEYFNGYLAMVEAGKASNHLIISTRPRD